jgi:hypothetical protein
LTSQDAGRRLGFLAREGRFGVALAVVLSLLVLTNGLAVGSMPDPRIGQPLTFDHDGAFIVTYTPAYPRVGQTVTFYVEMTPNESNCAGHWFGDYSCPRNFCGLVGMWLLAQIHPSSEKCQFTTYFPCSGVFSVHFTKTCGTGDFQNRYMSSVTVTVSGEPSCETSPASPAQPSTPATAAPTQPVQPSAPATPTLPADLFLLGDYRLREVSLLQCASVLGRPYTSVIVTTADSENLVLLQNVTIDSGADRSFFPAWVAEELGIDLTTCPKSISTGVGGETITYDAEVHIAIIHMGGTEKDVQGYILASNGKPLFIKTTASFSADSSLCLLGRADVFDALTIIFQGDTATVTPAVR